MQIIELEIILLWMTVLIYAAASVVFAWELVRKKGTEFVWAVRLTALGLLPLTAALALRWWQTGHGPFMRRFEVYSSDVWVVVVLYLLLQRWRPGFRFTGVIIAPSSFLLIGMAVMASPEIRPLPAFYGTFWLIVHILFAKLAYGFLLIGTVFAVFYLLKSRAERLEAINLDPKSMLSEIQEPDEASFDDAPPIGRRHEIGLIESMVAHLPALETLHEQSYRNIAMGFIMLAIMIAAGAIWANKAWGRYWSWDPVETWSIICWLLYGIYLHLVRTYGWFGKRPAIMVTAAVFVMIFALFGVGLIYNSLHSPYIR